RRAGRSEQCGSITVSRRNLSRASLADRPGGLSYLRYRRTMHLERLRWPEIEAAAPGRVFVVPLGSLEQHGHHLPLFTDSLIIGRIADRVEELRSENIVLLPGRWLGPSPLSPPF